ncbi:MAG: hypothetical protein R3E76_15790 [Planctomycetota bacterium]
MKGLLPLSGLVLCGALICGCQDNSQDVEKLKSDLVAQQKHLDESNDRWASERDTMRAEIEDLKKQLGTLNQGDAAAIPVADRIAKLESRLDEASDGADNSELETKLDALGKQVDGMKSEIETVKLEAANGGGTVDEEKVAELMAKRLAEEQAANAPTKDLGQALDRLKISEGEKDQIRQHIIDAKKQILETLEVPDENGRVYAEELIDAFIKIQNGDGKMTDVQTLFVELSTKKIPGDIEGRTYAEAIDAIKAENKEDIGRILTEDDQKKLTNAHDDWTDFEVGDGDPWGELYMERLQKINEEK